MVGLAPVAARAQDRPVYTLERLIAEGQRTHGTVVGAQHGVESARQLLTEAQRAWWPNFSVEGLVAPSVDVHCATPQCLEGDIRNPTQVYPTGVLSRWELRMGFPIYTFGKFSNATKAAEQGLYSSESRLEAARQEIAINVKRAYYGVKVARELLDMIKEGRDKLEDAIKEVEEDLEKGKSSGSETDRLRLRVAETLVDARTLEARKAETLALAGLRALAPSVPQRFDIDPEPIEPVTLPERPPAFYIEAARRHRPEAQMVRFGRDAARANLEINKSNFYPDIVLGASLFGLWKTTDDDDPLSPYMLHPFASYGYGGGLFVRWGLDLHLKIPRYLRAREDYEGALAFGQAADDGMALEVTTAYESVTESRSRLALFERGEKTAHSWLTAIAQNYAIGTAEAREFNDALLAYFEAKSRYIQAIFDFNMSVAWLHRVVGVDVTSDVAK
ncbi:MAG TPA: TolC family protein [Polyangia bacterium]|nr:TolC family protein [Polyangia bacterium]